MRMHFLKLTWLDRCVLAPKMFEAVLCQGVSELWCNVAVPMEEAWPTVCPYYLRCLEAAPLKANVNRRPELMDERLCAGRRIARKSFRRELDMQLPQARNGAQ